jgi:hypothetical protein
MAEPSNYTPDPAWQGHDYGSARAVYAQHVDRSYGDAKAAGKTEQDVTEPSLTTQSPSPVVIFCDVTGSVGHWLEPLFEKLPYVEHEAKDYLGAATEIAFGAIGDANESREGEPGDTYPFQIRPFAKGTATKDRLNELVVEKGGGGQQRENYELAALYAARNIHTPMAVRKPILIMIGDEVPYETVNVSHARRFAHVVLQGPLTAEEVFRELRSKFAVYFIKKPYSPSSGDTMGPDDLRMLTTWQKLLGEDHVCVLNEPGRVVDVIFGILAQEVNRVDDFHREIEGRQTPDQVHTVYKSLTSIHKALPSPTGQKRLGDGQGNSIMKLGSGKDTKPLLGG